VHKLRWPEVERVSDGEAPIVVDDEAERVVHDGDLSWRERGRSILFGWNTWLGCEFYARGCLEDGVLGSIFDDFGDMFCIID